MHSSVTQADLPPYAPRKPLPGGGFGHGPCARKNVGQHNRRILGTIERDGYRYSYHATKGMRRERIVDAAPQVGARIPAPGSARYALTVPAKVYLNGPGKRARRLAAMQAAQREAA